MKLAVSKVSKKEEFCKEECSDITTVERTAISLSFFYELIWNKKSVMEMEIWSNSFRPPKINLFQEISDQIYQLNLLSKK